MKALHSKVPKCHYQNQTSNYSVLITKLLFSLEYKDEKLLNLVKRILYKMEIRTQHYLQTSNQIGRTRKRRTRTTKKTNLSGAPEE